MMTSDDGFFNVHYFNVRYFNEILRLGKNSRILTNSVMGMNARNNYVESIQTQKSGKLQQTIFKQLNTYCSVVTIITPKSNLFTITILYL